MYITSYAIRKRIAVAVITCGLLVLGMYGLWRLPVTYLPEVTYPLIKVNIWWSGATPAELDKNIADPVERALSTVDGVETLESSSIEGMYSLFLNFRYGTSIDAAYQDTLAAMARATRQMPKDIDPPVVTKADPTQLPIAQIIVRSDSWDLVKLRTWAENWLDPIVTAVPGVGGTEVLGGFKREIRVLLDADALIKHELSIQGVLDILRAENIEQFGGRIVQGSKEFIARTTGEYESLDDIRNLVIAHLGHSKVLLKDIATVEDTHQDIRLITRIDGAPGLKLSILKQADANTVDVAKKVEARLESIKSSLPQGITLGIVENQATYVEASINGVRSAAIDAAVLVILVIYLFLGSWRQVVLMSLVLPITVAINFGLMQLAGFSLNIFSLGGLVVAIGVVLDNATVVVENITRLRHGKEHANISDIAEQGTNEVGPAIIAATLSFMALFIPFLLVPGLTSLLFKELILVIAGIVILSLAIAVSLVPTLSTILLGSTKPDRFGEKCERFYIRVADRYAWLLENLLRRKIVVLAGFSLILVAGLALVPLIGSEFLPKVDDGRITIKVKMPTGTSVEETDSVLRSLEKFVVKDPLVSSYFTLSGGLIRGQTTTEIAAEGQIDIQLVPRDEREVSTLQYISKLRPQVSKVPIPGGRAMVMQAKMRGIRSTGDAEIEIKIRGQELTVLADLARTALGKITSMGKLTNTYISLDMSRPEYQVRVDRVRAAELGVSVTAVSTSLRTLLNGVVATQFRDQSDYYDIRLMVPEAQVNNPADIAKLPVRSAQGSFVRLGDVAQVVPALGPVEITRENQVKQVIVRADTAGISVGEARKAIADVLQEKLPPGYEITYGGQAQMMAEMVQAFGLILAFALFFSFIVLAVQFNSLKLPSLILASVPFCSIGMVFALFIAGLPLGATVIIGALIVISSTVNEGVLLITFAEELRNTEKLSPTQAIIKAGMLRLRPRLMIAITVVAGLIPLALNIKEGGDMLQPMAVAGIGGLLMGIFVALFMVPCMYVLFTPDSSSKAI